MMVHSTGPTHARKWALEVSGFSILLSKALNVEVGANVDIDHVHLAQVVEVEPVY
jgi:hypothetical protein